MARLLPLLCLTLTIPLSKGLANDHDTVVGTQIAYTNQQCIDGYRTMQPKELGNGGCYGSHRPLVKCFNASWPPSKIAEATDSYCLRIIYSTALNTFDTKNYRYNDDFTFKELRGTLALFLSQNELFTEELSKIDRVHLEKIGKQAPQRFK